MDKITPKKIVRSAISRDLNLFEDKTSNLYKTVVILSKRANQISSTIKEELQSKLSEFATDNDNLEEIFENREQIEISSYYERMPKSTLMAIEELMDDKIYFRSANEDTDNT